MRLILVLLFSTISVLSQSTPQEYRMQGVVETPGGDRLPAVSLSIERDGMPFKKNGRSVGGFSDMNGVFWLELPTGNYKITAHGIPETRFRLFLSIDEHGPKPDRLFIPMEENVYCPLEGRLNPLPTKTVTPVFPPAARAVRAMGNVSVAAEISPDGSVSSAKAISGHPLLRSSSVTAARGFTFEASEQNLRKITIPFLFTDWAEERKDIKRVECPNRILVSAPRETIDISTSN